MNMSALLSTLALLLVAANPGASQEPTFLMPNAITTDAALANSWKGEWLGAFADGEGGLSLQPVHVAGESYGGDAEASADGDPVRFFPTFAPKGKAEGELLFLVRALAGVKMGSPQPPIDVNWRPTELLPGTSLDFGFGGEGCTLQAEGTALFHQGYDRELRNYALRLLRSEDPTIAQTLWAHSESFQMPPALTWVGDLDQDGVADLILEIPQSHPSHLLYQLYLSSRAGAGEVLGKVGEVEGFSDGC